MVKQVISKGIGDLTIIIKLQECNIKKVQCLLPRSKFIVQLFACLIWENMKFYLACIVSKFIKTIFIVWLFTLFMYHTFIRPWWNRHLTNLFFQILSFWSLKIWLKTPIIKTVILHFSNMMFFFYNLLEQSYKLNFTLVKEWEKGKVLLLLLENKIHVFKVWR